MPIFIFFIVIIAGLAIAFSVSENKKLIECKTCGKQIAKSAKRCPHCGASSAGKIVGDIVGGTIGGCCLVPVIIVTIVIIVVVFNLFGAQKEVDSSAITLSEFDQIQYGMSYDECVQIIGSDGTISSQMTMGNVHTKTVTWDGNNGAYSGATITFQDETVHSMFQNNLK